MEKDHRITVENEAYLAIVFRRLCTEIVSSLLESAGIEGADRPVAHEKEAGLAGQHHVGGRIPSTPGDARIHPVDHLAELLEGSDHSRAAHRVRAAFDKSLAK